LTASLADNLKTSHNRGMMNDNNDQSLDSEFPPDEEFPDAAELRYAPTGEADEDDPVEAVAIFGTDKGDDLPENVPVSQETPDVAIPPVDDMDIEGALAAVASLSDMLAEQEAAEQARIAHAEAEAKEMADRQARLEHPELFFPMPSPMTLYRGQIASVVPALLLIATGVWLTFAFTTSPTQPDPGLTAAIAAGGIAITLLVRWLSSGRWARGTLFFALLLLLTGTTTAYLLQPASVGFMQGWPLFLIAIGGALLLTGFIAQPVDRRLLLPAILLFVAGLAAMSVTLNLLDDSILTVLGSLWPIVLVLVAAILLLPMVFRQRQ
jgi:hypothetical protein